jgi:hypothetical protein
MHVLLEKGLITVFEEIAKEYKQLLDLTSRDSFMNSTLVRNMPLLSFAVDDIQSS